MLYNSQPFLLLSDLFSSFIYVIKDNFGFDVHLIFMWQLPDELHRWEQFTGRRSPWALASAAKRKDARRVALLFSLFNKTHRQLLHVQWPKHTSYNLNPHYNRNKEMFLWTTITKALVWWKPHDVDFNIRGNVLVIHCKVDVRDAFGF